MSIMESPTDCPVGDLTLDGLLTYAADRKGSDIFLKAGTPPAIKVNGTIRPTEFPPLAEADVERLAFEHVKPDQLAFFKAQHELNLSFSVPGVARIRQNVYQQRDTVATTCRLIPLKVKSLSELGITSKAINSFTDQHNGLVLVTGPTGSGKSTTLAAMIDHLNETRHANIITIEDPIEYVYSDKKAIVSQREVGIDTVSFNEALKQVLRQTPDVILIGELRDLDTMNVALQASETGHLVFATLHTSSAAETLDRISNMYQPHERAMLWLRLSVALRGVVSQKLLKRADGSGRIAAQEILVVTPTIANQLEEGQSSDIYGAIRQDGTDGFWGMQTMNQALEGYVNEEFITEKEALLNAGNTAELKQLLRRRANDRIIVDERQIARAV
jgi:twitching motility protein PilT